MSKKQQMKMNNKIRKKLIKLNKYLNKINKILIIIDFNDHFMTVYN